MSQARVIIPFPLPEVAVTLPKPVAKALVGFAGTAKLGDGPLYRMSVLRFCPRGVIAATDGHAAAVYTRAAAFDGPAFSVPVACLKGMLTGREELTVTRERVTDGRLAATFTHDEVAFPFPPLDDCVPARADDDDAVTMKPIGVNLRYLLLVERLQVACKAIGTRLQFGEDRLDPIRFDLDNRAAYGVVMPMNLGMGKRR